MAIGMGLGVEDGLREGEPLAFVVGRRIREDVLGGEHGAEAPEGLVVVAQRGGPVGVHVVVVGPRLEQQGLLGGLDVGRVTRVVPVVD